VLRSVVLRSTVSCVLHTINVLIVFLETVKLLCYHFTDRNQMHSEVELRSINNSEC